VYYALENEEDPSLCEISELTTKSAPAIYENESKCNKKCVTLTQGENSFELKFSTNHAIVEKLLVEPFNIFPLSKPEFLVVPCDKEELCEIDSFIPCHN
jgi:hypothetical protein